MTTVAMASGMFPVALSLTGGNSSIRQPMAIVVIGDVTTPTLLSRVVIPIIFTFADDLMETLKRLVHWQARIVLARTRRTGQRRSANDFRGNGVNGTPTWTPREPLQARFLKLLALPTGIEPVFSP